MYDVTHTSAGADSACAMWADEIWQSRSPKYGAEEWLTKNINVYVFSKHCFSNAFFLVQSIQSSVCHIFTGTNVQCISRRIRKVCTSIGFNCFPLWYKIKINISYMYNNLYLPMLVLHFTQIPCQYFNERTYIKYMDFVWLVNSRNQSIIKLLVLRWQMLPFSSMYEWQF